MSLDIGLQGAVCLELYIYNEVLPALNQRASKSININEVRQQFEERFPKKGTAVTLKLFAQNLLLSLSIYKKLPSWHLMCGQYFTIFLVLSPESAYFIHLTPLRNRLDSIPILEIMGYHLHFLDKEAWASQWQRRLPKDTHWNWQAQHSFHSLAAGPRTAELRWVLFFCTVLPAILPSLLSMFFHGAVSPSLI